MHLARIRQHVGFVETGAPNDAEVTLSKIEPFGLFPGIMGRRVRMIPTISHACG